MKTDKILKRTRAAAAAALGAAVLIQAGSPVFAAEGLRYIDVRDALAGGAAAIALKDGALEAAGTRSGSSEGSLPGLADLIKDSPSLRTVTIAFEDVEKRVTENCPAVKALEKARKAQKDQKEDATESIEAQISLYSMERDMYEAQVPALRAAAAGYESLAEAGGEDQALWEAAARAAEAQLGLAQTMSGALSAAVRGLESAADQTERAADNAYDIALIENAEGRALIVKAAEDLALSIAELQLQKDDIARARGAAQRSADALEIMVRYGKAAPLALEQAKAALKELEIREKSLDEAAELAGHHLAQMCGYEGAAAKISPLPQVSKEKLSAMDWDEDLKTVLSRSFEIRKARETEESTQLYATVAQKDAAQAALKDAESRAPAALRDLYDAVKTGAKDADLASEKTALARKTLESQAIRLKHGLISRNAYLDSEDEVKAAESAEKAALLSLFKAMNDYSWALRGVMK
ncbi:MAG: hypothetical protein IIU32_01710 [Firmicutes bacterium]|nr:hypothetical protein [Bacillota bacterium]